MTKHSRQTIFISLALTFVVFVGIYLVLVNKNQVVTVNSFDTCSAAGYPIMESYPARCMTPDGRSFTQSVEGQEITVTGTTVCLPHKDMSGPITLECAFGLKDNQGNHYALRDPEMQFMEDISTTDTTITVNGKLYPDNDSKYDIVGGIEIDSITQ